ncbi:MAG: PQQ-dependent dehydrogenase, methanol/ethanol family [Myxococcota bacterium]|nr:PQQ-dependent dehydrogenase, methanol/ethanol family [Myxococcota bacterium]
MPVRMLATLTALAALMIYGFGCSDSTPSGNADSPPTPASGTQQAESQLVGMIDDERIENAASEPGNWLAYGRTYEEQRFSPLSQINRETVGQLGLAWAKDMGTNRAQEATPIVVDGILFLTSSWSRVFAIDALTGETLWSFDPQVPGAYARKACCDVVNRGVAVYKGRVYFGSLDGRLFALDAKTGEEIWEVDTLIDRTRAYTITGAPRAARGKIYIGNGGAEFGVRGYVTAYDAETGEQAWRFFTVPGDPSLPFEQPELEAAAKTWKGGEWWKIGGGGTVWNSIVYDPDFNQIYLGVGNGSPWTRAIRSPGGGDNLFLSSVVAVDADTGVYKWHYQTTPGDNWDYTAVQDMALADMTVDGKERKVLLQAPKNGFFYVIDRSNGELLRAHPYAPLNWATHVDMETGRPVENPELDYAEKEKWVLPGPLGGHNWQSMSVDEEGGLVFIPVQQNSFIYGLSEEFKKTGLYKAVADRFNLGVEMGRVVQHFVNNLDTWPAPKGFLRAFNPLTGEVAWEVEIAHYWNGGVLATAGGLVFQGDAFGMLKAYDKETGEALWEFNTYTSMLAPPITYAIDGVQYVSILTGTGGGDLFSGAPLPPFPNPASLDYNNYGRLLVFKLGGDAKLEVPKARDMTIPEQEMADLSDAQIAYGEGLFHEYCAECHGLATRSGGVIPDLRQMSTETHARFDEIVLSGLLAPKGMAAFNDVLSAQDATFVHEYIRARAHEDREVALGNQAAPRWTWMDSAE